jgi:hypothetical protein
VRKNHEALNGYRGSRTQVVLLVGVVNANIFPGSRFEDCLVADIYDPACISTGSVLGMENAAVRSALALPTITFV